MTVEITFFVSGAPKTAGSKRGFPIRTGKINPKTGKEVIRVVITESCKGSKDWRGSVIAACKEKYSGSLLMGPLYLDVIFYMQRPKNHYRSNGELKKDAPRWHQARPDSLKLRRALEDALTSILWRDDAQICDGRDRKFYADQHFGTCPSNPGALVTVKQI